MLAPNPPGTLDLPLVLPLADKSYELIGFIVQVCTFNKNNSTWNGYHFKTYVKDQYDPQHNWYVCDDLAQNIQKVEVKDITTWPQKDTLWPQKSTFPSILVYRQLTDPSPDFARALDQI